MHAAAAPPPAPAEKIYNQNDFKGVGSRDDDIKTQRTGDRRNGQMKIDLSVIS